MSTLTARSPYDLVHPALNWTWTDRQAGKVTAHFDTATKLTTGADLVTGTYVDEYGWWHARVSLNLTDLPADLTRTGYNEPEAAPFPVTMNFEWRRGLVRLGIPDDVCRRLDAWKRDHWTEIHGMADGYSSSPKRGTWEHRALSYLHSVQSHTTDRMPFIEGVGFAATKDANGNGADYGLMLSTCGISTDNMPNARFYFSG